MNHKVHEKIQALMQIAKEGKGNVDQKQQQKIESNITNSFADNIKTQAQADTFMTLLKACK